MAGALLVPGKTVSIVFKRKAYRTVTTHLQVPPMGQVKRLVQKLDVSDEFVRVRIGVGKPPSKERGADHVLSRVSKRDREQMDVTIEEAADAVELIATSGIDAAMNRYNARAADGE
jgi:hypothetical protein